MSHSIKAVFLDRDGVINADSPFYVKSWPEFAFLPGSIEALRRLTQAGLGLFVVTNQSAVGRRYMTLDALEDMHRRMTLTLSAAGVRIADIFYCPHHPDEGCDCRKPRPGLLLTAARRYSLCLADTCMVGDGVRDLACGREVGVGAEILVLTGNGRHARETLARQGMPARNVASDLLEAAAMILSPEGPVPNDLSSWTGWRSNIQRYIVMH